MKRKSRTITKRIVSVVSLFWVSLVIVACGGSNLTTEKYKLEQNGGTTLLTFKLDGDTIVEQKSVIDIPYSSFGVTTKDEAKKALATYEKQYKGYKGISDKYEYGDSRLKETLSINYKQVDFKKISKLPGMKMDKNGAKAKRLSMKKTRKLLEDAGAKKQ